MLTITQERKDDIWEVEALYDLCFAPGRTALSSYRLREGVNPIAPLCFIAQDDDGTIGGAIRNWPVQIMGKLAILLGPVAVHPTRQGEGLGALLMRETINKAEDLGWERVLLVGDLPYYSRFGFYRLKGVKMPPPTNPDRVLGYELVDDAWEDIRGEVLRAPDCNPDGTPQIKVHGR